MNFEYREKGKKIPFITKDDFPTPKFPETRWKKLLPVSEMKQTTYQTAGSWQSES